MAFLIGGANSAADTAYDVANSCRFNDGDSAQLRKTPTGAGNLDKWTFSAWIKRGTLGITGKIFGCKTADPNSYTQVSFQSSDDITFVNYIGGSGAGQFTTNRVFRDTSAWYSIVVIFDSGNATAGDRMQLWVNGVRETSFSSQVNPDEDQNGHVSSANEHLVGGNISGGSYLQFFDGYMSEVVFLDGVAASPVDTLGEFDSDSPTIFKPKDPSGLTFGTNGFYLDFKASDNLGNDANGGTDLTEDNLAAADQATDSPTNNFCTLNPLNAATSGGFTYSEGNTKALSVGTWRGGSGTFGVSSGKWYFEVQGSGASTPSGVATAGYIASGQANQEHGYLGFATVEKSYTYHLNGKLYTVNTDGSQANASYGNTYTTEIIGIALNLDDNELKFYKSNTVQNSDTAISISAGTYMPILHISDSANLLVNFGGSSGFAISSAESDADGYGNFEYAPPSGFFALCTKNLAEYG